MRNTQWTPMRKQDWDDLVRDTSDGVGHRLTVDQMNRILTTLYEGWAPEEPTNDDLDKWAAKHVMRWHRIRDEPFWRDDDEAPTTGAIPWAPTERISQAFRVFMETEVDVSVDAVTHEECGRDVKSTMVTVDATVVHEGAFDEEAIARKIMVELWRRLGET